MLVTMLAEHPSLAEADEETRQAVESSLQHALSLAHRAHPNIPVADDVFVRALAHHMGKELANREAVANIHVEDLYLACACAAGMDCAISTYRRRVEHLVTAIARRFDTDSSFVDDVLQLLMQKVLVRDGEREPRIPDYSGQGALDAWTRIAATRVAIDLQRRNRVWSNASDEGILDAILPHEDAELEFARGRYLDEVNAAFSDAFAQLSPRERNVLRLHLLEGLNIERIGAIYHVHRSSVARWITRAKGEVLAESSRLLGQRLGASASEVRSLIKLVHSQAELHLSAVLAEPNPNAEPSDEEIAS